MAKLIDTWVTGQVLEGLKLIQITFDDDHGVPWGTAMGLGYVPKIWCRKSGGEVLFDSAITGQWVDSIERRAVFTLTTAFVPDTGTREQEYEFLATLTKNGVSTWVGADGSSQPWSFTVVRWP